jgi:O-acetyl-ADP-ribose deacetylase (regulator of RNase III)
LLSEVGDAIRTAATEQLEGNFDSIIHTVAPFYHAQSSTEEADRLLLACYHSAFDMLWGKSSGISGSGCSSRSLACPLVGAGTRGAPIEAAARIAAAAVADFYLPANTDVEIFADDRVVKYAVQGN